MILIKAGDDKENPLINC